MYDTDEYRAMQSDYSTSVLAVKIADRSAYDKAKSAVIKHYNHYLDIIKQNSKQSSQTQQHSKSKTPTTPTAPTAPESR